MSQPPMWRRYLRFWGPDPRGDVDVEISFHIDELVRRLTERGLSVEQAQAEATRRFGSAARVREACVAIDHRSRREATRREVLDALSQDLRDGLRALTRTPGFTIGVTVILALGIGLNTASFSFNKALLFPSLPVQEPARLVRMWSQNMARGIYVTGLSEADAATIPTSSRSLEDVAVFQVQPATLTGDAQPERIAAMRATTNLFPLLGVSPAIGRGFRPEDAVSGATRVAIVSDTTWRNRFARDPAAVGRDLTLDGQRHTIVGVMPERFWFESKDVEVWLPLPPPRAEGAHNPRSLMVVGRLNTNDSPEAAQADMHVHAERLAHESPESDADWDIAVTGLLPLGPGERAFFGLIITLTSLLLAAACAHIANLLLARGLERRGEVAIRSALGARRGRIVRQLLVESVALSFVGGLCSLGVAFVIVEELRAILGSRTPYLTDLSLDPTTLAFTAGLIVLTSALFGLAPAWRLSSVTTSEAMRQPPGGPIAGRRARPLASALIGLEVAVATLALIVTVLYVRVANNIMATPLGFDTDHVVTFRLDVPEYKYREPGAAARVLEDVHRRLQAAPFVRAAGAGSRPPFNGGAGLPTESIAVEDRPEIPDRQNPWAITTVVTPGYFEALGVPVVSGRAFEARDSRTAQPVVVVSRSTARAYWPAGDAVGHRVRMTGATPTPWMTVIGVVGDIRPFAPGSPQVRQMYVPFAQSPARALVFYARTLGGPVTPLTGARQVVRDVDPELPVLELGMMADAMDREMAGAQLGQRSLVVNAAIAVLLAISGVYSVVGFSVAGRRREIAIRVALGGTKASIVGLLLRQGLRPALGGLVVGLVLSAVVSRTAALVLFGVNPFDPLVYGVTAGVLCLAGAAASAIPALGVTKANTVAALRTE